MIEVTTKVFQSPELQRLFVVAPNQYVSALKKWLNNEKILFIGGRFRKGITSRDLLNKKVSGTNTPWDYRVANFFKGFIDDTGGGLKLVMGANLRGKSGGIQESIAKMMESGYTQTSSDNVLIPLYKNGVDFKLPRKLMLREFQEMLKAHKLFTVRSAGRIDFISNDTRKIMYISTRSITVPPQYNFVEKWNGRIPAATVRGQEAIDKETDKLSKGIYN
jgi:hypothetical protein